MKILKCYRSENFHSRNITRFPALFYVTKNENINKFIIMLHNFYYVVVLCLISNTRSVFKIVIGPLEDSNHEKAFLKQRRTRDDQRSSISTSEIEARDYRFPTS